MSLLHIEDRKLDPAQLARLTQQNPMIVTHDGKPVFVAHQAAPEWLEAWLAEEEKTGDTTLREYAGLYQIPLTPKLIKMNFQMMRHL